MDEVEFVNMSECETKVPFQATNRNVVDLTKAGILFERDKCCVSDEFEDSTDTNPIMKVKDRLKKVTIVRRVLRKFAK